MNYVTSRLRNECNLVPIFFRERACRIEIMPSRCCKSAKNIHLTHFLRDRPHVLVRIRIFRTIQSHRRMPNIAVRNGHIPAVRVICRRSKHIPSFIEIKSPGIVRSRRHVLHLRSICLEAEECLCKLKRIRSHFALITGITYATPDPVIESIM